MKLYTEEQVIEIAYWITASHMTREKVKSSLKDLNQQKSLTPIELPSDDEIKQYSIGYALVNEDVSDKLDNYLVSAIHIDGAMWLKKQILNQNK